MQNKTHSSSRLLTQCLGISQKTLRDAYRARESYVMHRQKKPSGGFRIIHESPEVLKYVQRRILYAIFYPMFRNNCIDKRMFGFLPYKSVSDNAYEHARQPWNFSYKLDLKDAFPSVKSVHLSVALRTIMLDKTQEIVEKFKAQEENYADLLAGSKEHPHRRLFQRKPHSELHKNHTFSFKTLLGRTPNSAWFRTLLLGNKDEYVRAQLLIIEVVDMITDLCTLPSGVLPQGAPASGFILTLVATHSRILDVVYSTLFSVGCNSQSVVSMYADDIAFSTMKRVAWNPMSVIIAQIERLGIWKVHPDKIFEYDRRSTGPIICGMRIGRYRIFSERQCRALQYHIDAPHSRLAERVKNGGAWSIDFVTVPKKLKKKIRALEYKLKMNPGNEALRNVVMGYRGYLIDITRKSRLPHRLFATVQ